MLRRGPEGIPGVAKLVGSGRHGCIRRFERIWRRRGATRDSWFVRVPDRAGEHGEGIGSSGGGVGGIGLSAPPRYPSGEALMRRGRDRQNWMVPQERSPGSPPRRLRLPLRPFVAWVGER